MNIAIIGAGATGGYLAARLAAAGNEVTLAARGASASRISSEGIRVTENGTTREARPARVLDTSELPTARELGGAVDLIIISVKTTDTSAVLPVVDSLRGPASAILSLQNGVHVDDLLAGEFGAGHIMSGVLYIGAHRTGPGQIVCTAPARVILGPYHDGGGSCAVDPDGLANVLMGAGINAILDDQILTAKWQKFLFNCGLNPLTALTGRTMGVILADPVLEQLYLDLVTEAARAGLAAGAPVADDAVDVAVATARSMDISSSMAEDLAAGRPLELDAFSGHVLNLCERTGLDAPSTRVIDALLRVATK